MQEKVGQLDLSLPKRMGAGGRSAEKKAKREAAVTRWCGQLLQLKESVDFDPGARGWCYLMEEHGLSKGDFNDAQDLITECRKDGKLPFDFCGDDDSAREFIHVETITDDPDPRVEAKQWADSIKSAPDRYDPLSFWDYQDNYVQMLVEKIGLRNLFDPVCEEFRVSLANTKGSWSLWQRMKLMERFAEWQEKGKHCALLYCGDHDIHGLRISEFLFDNLVEMMPAFERHCPHLDLNLDEIEIVRFGLNADFIKKHRLSWTQGLITGTGKDLADPSHSKHFDHDVQSYIEKFGAKKLEADALVTRAQAGRRLCRDAILQYIDTNGIEDFEQARQEKRDKLREEINRLLGDDGGTP
jgi:hypothetical protein